MNRLETLFLVTFWTYLVISYLTLLPSKIGRHTTKSLRFSQIVFRNFWGKEANVRTPNSSSTSNSCDPGDETTIWTFSPFSNSMWSNASAITYFFYNFLWKNQIKWVASSRWSIGPKSALGSIETTIGKTLPILIMKQTLVSALILLLLRK